jgi:hypothetical protein
MPPRDSVLPAWMLDGAGAPRKGRVLDPLEDDGGDVPNQNAGMPSLADLPQIGGPAAAGVAGPAAAGPAPGSLGAIAAGVGGSAAGAPPPSLPSGPPPGPPPGMPPPGLPSGLGGPPMGPPPGGLAGLAPPPLPGSLPPLSPALLTGGPRPTLPGGGLNLPPPPVPPAQPVIGMGAASPNGQAPVMHVSDSVVNVGTQTVTTQGAQMSGAQGPDSAPLAPSAPPPTLGPPPARLPDLSSGGPAADDAPAVTGGLAERDGPVWDHATQQYKI